jgi:hypothetical protein
MEAVSSSDGPTGDDRNDHFGHESDQSLHFEDVKTTYTTWINGFFPFTIGVLVSVFASDPLIAARAERPTPVLGRGAVTRQEDTTHVCGLACMLECDKHLVDGVGAEGVANLGPVEGDTHSAHLFGAVIGDVGEVESRNLVPG